MPDLKIVLKYVDMLIVNDAEARQLTGLFSLVKAAKAILQMGPKYLIIKKENTVRYYFMEMKFSLLLLCH